MSSSSTVITTSLDGATGVLQDSVEEFVAPVSKSTALVSPSESLEELSNFIAGVEDERTVAEVIVTIVDFGVDPLSSGSVKSSAVSNAGWEGSLERDSAENDLTGVDWRVSLGKQTGSSDVAEVDDNDCGRVESGISMFIQTSPFVMPVAWHTGVE